MCAASAEETDSVAAPMGKKESGDRQCRSTHRKEGLLRRALTMSILAVAAVLIAACGDRGANDNVAATTTSRPTTTAVAESTTTPTSMADRLPEPPTTPTSGFQSSVESISSSTAARMSASWRPGCSVPLEDLRLITLTHVGFDGQPRTGELVVHAEVADDVVGVFRGLFDAQFPIEQIRLVDDFGGDDDRSMEANNTSAFNCRRATGSTRWSAHSYGKAIDISPVQNPYVTRSGSVLPPAGSAFVNRASSSPGVITTDGAVVRAFDGIGWGWGGRWSSGKDYQHFSASGT